MAASTGSPVYASDNGVAVGSRGGRPSWKLLAGDRGPGRPGADRLPDRVYRFFLEQRSVAPTPREADRKMTSTEKQGSKEKVRGMNASLAEGNGGARPGPLRERDPGRLHITRRQIAFALVLAVAAVIAAIYTVNSVTAGRKAYAAVVTTSKVYDLNFANPGRSPPYWSRSGSGSRPARSLLARTPPPPKARSRPTRRWSPPTSTRSPRPRRLT